MTEVIDPIKESDDDDGDELYTGIFPEVNIEVAEDGKSIFPCNKCHRVYYSRRSLGTHKSTHARNRIKGPKKRFKCEVCGKDFGKFSDMDRHMRVHTGEKPSVCTICNKGFQQQHNLTKHLLTHLHVKPFECETCHKQFGRNDVLARHLLTHSADKPFKCKYCDKGFIRQSQLDQHLTKRHQDDLLRVNPGCDDN